MFPPKNFFENYFFYFKITGKIPKLNFSKFENLMLNNGKFKVVLPLKIFQGKMKIFKFFQVLKCSRQKMLRKLFFFNFEIPGKIPNINFSKFENLMLKNSKVQGVFPLTIFQGKMEIFKFFLVLECSRQKNFENFLISEFLANFPKLIFEYLKI
jgi:hypothetical protein